MAFAGNNHGKAGPSPKSEHELTVGNDKVAASGNTTDDKMVEEEKTHKEHSKSHKKN